MGDLTIAGPVTQADHDETGPLDANERGMHAGPVGQQDGHPLGDGFPDEDARSEGLTIYGEADHEKASEKEETD